ncbi:MAG: hypothetical protein PHI36_04915 [Bacteroidales bacterium]|nr:hypothetical protein [Bacteroidales bacterium]MDD4575749.1 hypothetical protein [Bacteroidales bacterium]
MKKQIYLTALLALLFACSSKNEKVSDAKNPVIEKQENIIATESNNGAAVNIKDIFLLLPDDAFKDFEKISVSNRSLLLKHIGEEKAYDISQTPIDVCDVKNGFLSLTGTQFGWEMCYWNLKNGQKLVAVNDNTEFGSKIRVFFYQNGKLTEDPNYKLGGNQKFKLSDFIDVSKLSSKTQKFTEKQFAKGAYSLYYQLPRNGTSIKVSLDLDQLINNDENFEIPNEITKDVILKWENEKWVKQL